MPPLYLYSGQWREDVTLPPDLSDRAGIEQKARATTLGSLPQFIDNKAAQASNSIADNANIFGILDIVPNRS